MQGTATFSASRPVAKLEELYLGCHRHDRGASNDQSGRLSYHLPLDMHTCARLSLITWPLNFSTIPDSFVLIPLPTSR